MSRPNIVLPPYPVQLGSIKFDSCEKQLHEYVKGGNYVKAKQMLKKGVFPDSINSLGQSPLFVAALLGLRKIVDLLLEYGSNPNHRCFDWSTPVHAAAFSCNQWIMSKLIDAGGDLRLHDEKSRRPYDWALMARRDQSAQILELIDHCSAHMHVLIHGFYCKPKNIVTSQELINSSSLIERLSPRNVVKSAPKDQKCKSISVKKTCSFGYGELYLRDNSLVGFIATVPFIEEKSIVQDDSKPAFCYPAGPYMAMTNLMWGCTEVTVKGLKEKTHEDRFVDLLIEEQKIISNLHHPLILHLLAVCTSSGLERTWLVFEKVTFGSLYSILHEKRSEFPVLTMETIVNLLIQAIDGLVFLHWRGFIHCSFSSHAIQVVSAGQAKISHFEYMIQSNDDRTHHEVAYFAIPDQLYRWSSPEIVLRKSVTVKSDLYSFCAVMQESLTDCLPWDGMDGRAIKHAMALGHYLNVDPRLVKPFDTIAAAGLQARPEKRTMNLQDIKYLIKNDLKNVVGGATHGSRNADTQTVAVESIKHSEQQYLEESQADIFCGISEEASTVYSVIGSPESRSFSTAKDYGMQDFVSSPESSSQQSAYETSLSSDFGEDTDYESSTSDDAWQRASQKLKDGLTSILAHHRSTLENLLYIQEFLGTCIINPLDEENEQFENVQPKETSNKCFPHTSTDEVDNIVQQFPTTINAERRAVAPPKQFYIPPGIVSRSRNVFEGEVQKDATTMSECFGGTRRKAIRKNKYCDAHIKFKGGNPQNPVTTQISDYIASNISDNCKSDDDGLMKNRFDTRRRSTQQLPTISLSGHRKAPDWHSERCLSSEDGKSCGTLWETIPTEDTYQETDDSSETSYFTPETQLSSENSHEKILSSESDKSIEDLQEQNSPEASGSSINTTQEESQIVRSARETTFEKDMPRVTTISSSPDSKSVIDVEGLSTILLDLKCTTKHFTPPKSLEASARHSTPVNQATCSKIKSSLPEQESPGASSWASIESHKSIKSSMTFFSADYDINSVEQLQEKTTVTQGTSIKNQGLVCIVGSLENAANNKTDCECQSMDITSLLNETEKTSNCG